MVVGLPRRRRGIVKKIEWRGEVSLLGGKVEQILVNLLSNAADAVPPGKGVVEVVLRADGAELVLEVADNGPGVPAHLADRVFDAFVTTKPEGVGTGLGTRHLAPSGRFHGRVAHRGTGEPGRGGVHPAVAPRSGRCPGAAGARDTAGQDRSARGGRVSAGDLWRRVRDAWAMLAASKQDVIPGRTRTAEPAPPGDLPDLRRDGFAEEALPWLDAVYMFALRLTRGDHDAADDLVQETFVNAYRSWHTFECGTNARSWLFTICRNAMLKGQDRSAAKREVPASTLQSSVDTMAGVTAFSEPPMNPEGAFFHQALDDEVVRAIDALPEEFREVLVLSDLGDLKYRKITRVLGLPIGTVKSRLFRARRLLQEELLTYAREVGYVSKGRPAGPRRG